MQRDKIQKPKVRFTRNADGSIGIPRDDTKTDELVELWGKQSASLEIPRLSIKQELSKLKQAYTKKLTKKPRQKNQTTVTPTVKKAYSNKIEKVPKPTTATETRPITITVSIPALRIPKKISAIPRKPALIGLAMVFVVAIGVIVLKPGGGSSQTSSSGQVQGAVDSGITTNVKPSFPVLTPNGNGVDDLGGLAKINPPGKPDVYVFTDNLSGTPVKVSQQKAPEEILSDPTKINEIAKQFNATKTFEAGEFTVYNGVSIKGPQSLIYTKGDLLVLIVADKELSSAVWVDYIGNLRF